MQLPTTSRNGHGALVHVYLNDQSISENEGVKRSVETDLRENYRVKIHKHGYVGPSESVECNCQILGTGQTVADLKKENKEDKENKEEVDAEETEETSEEGNEQEVA